MFFLTLPQESPVENKIFLKQNAHASAKRINRTNLDANVNSNTSRRYYATRKKSKSKLFETKMSTINCLRLIFCYCC